MTTAEREAHERRRKEASERMIYAYVKSERRDLYDRVVLIASTVPNLPLEQRSELEAQIMCLAADALGQ